MIGVSPGRAGVRFISATTIFLRTEGEGAQLRGSTPPATGSLTPDRPPDMPRRQATHLSPGERRGPGDRPSTPDSPPDYPRRRVPVRRFNARSYPRRRDASLDETHRLFRTIYGRFATCFSGGAAHASAGHLMMAVPENPFVLRGAADRVLASDGAAARRLGIRECRRRCAFRSRPWRRSSAAIRARNAKPDRRPCRPAVAASFSTSFISQP